MADVAIIGGGLAGLTAAIHLAKAGIEVEVFEKKSYPRHKVCGEYISAEVLPYFAALGAPLDVIQPNIVRRFRLHAPSGAFVESHLPLGGLGISRYALDHYLYEKAKSYGVVFYLNATVVASEFEGEDILLKTQKGAVHRAKIVLGAYGKRSKLDKHFKRRFFNVPADYVGIKFYIKSDFPQDLVALYNFSGGYAGAVQVEDGSIDVAYLVRNEQLQAYGSITRMEEELLYRNPAIKALFTSGERYPSKSLAISNVSFLPKQQVEDHVLMLGDAAGMIPPLAGNGMAMAIHAAKLAAEKGLAFLNQQINRKELEQQYNKMWQKQFGHRLYWGRKLHQFMGKKFVSEMAVHSLKTFPPLLKPIIQQTHGKPIVHVQNI